MRASLAYAALCAALALTWQSLTVRYNYGGNWTGLFCTGERLTAPPELDSEKIHRFAGINGYDGQFYHYIAHAPFFGHAEYVDAPRLRYRRILVPGLAYLLGGGRYVDMAYYGVILASIFLGAFWVSSFAVSVGRRPAWGLLFLAFPSTLISIDRLTVDVALDALVAGFMRHSSAYAILIFAPLVRETGLMLTLASGLARRAPLVAVTAVPALAWFAIVQMNTTGYRAKFFNWPLHGFITRLLDPAEYPMPPVALWTAVILDYVAMLGAVVAIAMVPRVVRRRGPDRVSVALILMAIMVATLQWHFWGEPYSFSRVLSPVFVLLALDGLAFKQRWALLPLAMVVPRVGLHFGRQILNVMQGLLS